MQLAKLCLFRTDECIVLSYLLNHHDYYCLKIEKLHQRKILTLLILHFDNILELLDVDTVQYGNIQDKQIENMLIS